MVLAGQFAQAQVDFDPAVDYDLSGAGPRDIVVDHFNADSAPDLAVTSAQGDGKLTVLLNDGNGDFSDDQPFTVGWSAWGIASGNLDTDSAIDLLATDGNAASNAVYLYKGNGNGGFSALGSLTAGTFPSAVVTGQFNADTHLDIAVASGQGGIMVFTGNGDGSFGAGSAVAEAASLAFQDLGVALLDNNATPDLLSPRAAFLGDGQGGFSRSASFGGEVAVASGRFNNDAFSDVVAITASQIQIWLGNGDGSFSFGSIHAPGGTLSDVAAADLDGDQIADVVVCDNANDRVAVLLGTGNGGLGPPQYFATGSEPQAVAIGDWNNDQRPDLAVPFRNFGEIARVSILLQRPAQTRAGSLQFQQGGISVEETVGSLLATVTRSGGSDGVVSVQYATANISAAARQDYQPVSGELVFGDGVVSRNIQLDIIDDASPEATETFQLSLSNPGGGASLGNPASFVVSIAANDGPPPGPSIFDDGFE